MSANNKLVATLSIPIVHHFVHNGPVGLRCYVASSEATGARQHRSTGPRFCTDKSGAVTTNCYACAIQHEYAVVWSENPTPSRTALRAFVGNGAHDDFEHRLLGSEGSGGLLHKSAYCGPPPGSTGTWYAHYWVINWDGSFEHRRMLEFNFLLPHVGFW